MNYKIIERIMNLRSKFYIEVRLFDRARWIASKMGYKLSFFYTPVDENRTLLLDHELYKINGFFERVKKHLGLPDLWIEWVEEDKPRNYRVFRGVKSDKPLCGEANPGTSNKISIRADISFDEILRTVAHEAHHCWFFREHGKSSYWQDEEMREGTADVFAGKMMIEFKDKDREARLIPGALY